MAKKDIGEFVRKSEFLSISQNNGVLEEKKKTWNTRESMQPWSSSPVRSEETHNAFSNILKLLKTIVYNFPSMSRERNGNVFCGVVENTYSLPRRGEVGSHEPTPGPARPSWEVKWTRLHNAQYAEEIKNKQTKENTRAKTKWEINLIYKKEVRESKTKK